MPKKGKATKRGGKGKTHDEAAAPTSVVRVWPWAMASAVVLWAAFPPVGWSLLAWIAPLGWLHIAARAPTLSRRNYITLWLSGCVFWLATLQGIRLAYWPLYFGWLALSLYLAAYIPAFVFVVRKMQTAWRLPLFLAAPVGWVALEFARTYILTGYCANMVAHSQVDLVALVQIADIFGAFGVSFVVMTGAGAFTAIVSPALPALEKSGAGQSGGGQAGESKETQESLIVSLRRNLRGATAAVALVLASVSYGQMRLRQADEIASQRPGLLTTLLVQENAPTFFEPDENRIKQAWDDYVENTRQLTQSMGPADLVVWPESTFSAGLPWLDPELPDRLPDDVAENEQAFLAARQQLASDFNYKVRLTQQAATSDDAQAPPVLLLGCDSGRVTARKLEKFNSAILVDAAGQVTKSYDKMHRVMFGEYIPLGPLLKPLRDSYPIGIDAGTNPVMMEVAGAKIAPNICFESMMPRVLLRQLRELVGRDENPQVLVNLSNDSWFRGSSMLDHHLACTRLCSIELRKPTLVAANTGLSAWIDGGGRLVECTERGAVTGILAEPREDNRFSGPIRFGGYPLAWFCLLAVAAAFVRRPPASAE